MKNFPANSALRLLYFAILLPCFLLFVPAEAAPKTSPAGATLSLPEKGPLPVDATVAGLPVTLRGSSVIVSAGNNDALKHVDLEADALTPFMALLKAYPRARRVELSWYAPIFLDANSADVLYDRVKHTVTVDYSDGGGEGPQYAGTVQFTHVREFVFAAILKAHPKGISENDLVSDKIADAHDNNAAAWGGFQLLYQPRYGCHARVVKARRKVGPLRAMSR